MNSNKINIKGIIILSAIILLLCIICAILTIENRNKSNIQSNNRSTVNITQPYEELTQTSNYTEPIAISTAPTSTATAMSSQNNSTEAPTKSTPATEPYTTPTAEPPTLHSLLDKTKTQATTSATEAPTTNDEELLNQIIAHSGYTLNDIQSIEAKQLIVVTDYTLDYGATAYFFSLNDNTWHKENLDCKVYVGSGGIGNKTSDSDNITPKGLYTIGEAFYTDNKPSTWLNTFKITSNTYWITDKSSDMYNKKLELENDEDFNNAIHMLTSQSYRYGCVINYNTQPVINGKGCAIFMECGTSATSGSIAFNEEDLLKYLKILNSEKNPAIIIF